MIIWGSKVKEIVESQGDFYCPECSKGSHYKLKKVCKYFTLYFIPLFQTKELGRFVECQLCSNQYKEEVLNYTSQGKPSSAANEHEESRFSSITDLAQLAMDLSSVIYSEQLKKITPDQEKQYLAFEFGILEYFNKQHLSLTETDDSDVRFFNFLIYYANKKYGESSENIFQLWRSLAVHGLMGKERKLGFDSVNNQRNSDGTKREGHFPGAYLQEALGIEL